MLQRQTEMLVNASDIASLYKDIAHLKQYYSPMWDMGPGFLTFACAYLFKFHAKHEQFLLRFPTHVLGKVHRDWDCLDQESKDSFLDQASLWCTNLWSSFVPPKESKKLKMYKRNSIYVIRKRPLVAEEEMRINDIAPRIVPPSKCNLHLANYCRSASGTQ